MQRTPHFTACRLSIALGVVLMAVSAGCADPERLPVYDRTLQVEQPIVLERHVAILNRTLEEVVLIEVDGADLSFDHLPVGREPVALTRTPDGGRLAVLSRRDKTITVIDVETSARRVYGLESEFDALTFSPDGRYAIAYFVPGGVRPPDVFINPNEYAVVDMEAPPGSDEAVLSRSLRGFGSSPHAVHFIPQFELTDAGTSERYAMFFFDSQVSFVDLATDDGWEKTVWLSRDQTEQAVYPREVMFTEHGDAALQDTYIYVLADNSNDVFVINLVPGEVHEGKVRAQPIIDLKGSGSRPSDIDTFLGPDGREKLLTVNSGSQSVAVIDAATADMTVIPLEAPANAIYLYEAYREETDQVEPHALVFWEGGTTRFVSFIRLLQVEDRLGQAVELLALERGIQSLIGSPVEGQVLLLHDGGAGISLLDLNERAYSPLQAQSNVTDLVVDSEGNRLYAALSGSPRLNWVDLNRGQASSLPLDYPIERLRWLPAARSLLAFHSREGGSVTAMGLDNAEAAPTRDVARIYSGFYLDAVLEGIDQ